MQNYPVDVDLIFIDIQMARQNGLQAERDEGDVQHRDYLFPEHDPPHSIKQSPIPQVYICGIFSSLRNKPLDLHAT